MAQLHCLHSIWIWWSGREYKVRTQNHQWQEPRQVQTTGLDAIGFWGLICWHSTWHGMIAREFKATTKQPWLSSRMKKKHLEPSQELLGNKKITINLWLPCRIKIKNPWLSNEQESRYETLLQHDVSIMWGIMWSITHSWPIGGGEQGTLTQFCGFSGQTCALHGGVVYHAWRMSGRQCQEHS